MWRWSESWNGIEKLFNYDVKTINQSENYWILNGEIKANKLFLCTGANISLINEDYFKLRAVWGQKIDILTTTKVLYNYHKECSISKSVKENEKYNYYSISCANIKCAGSCSCV